MLDNYDLARLNGFKGSIADYQKAVYLVNGFEALRKSGFGGTEADARRLLADSGASLSAYDVAVKHGYEGSPIDWLKTLRGSNGLDAYQVAVNNGFVGTEKEWLKAITGPAGASAYDLAVQAGFSGTVTQWLASLKGEKGDSIRGPAGPMPAHQWEDGLVRFELSPGVWGEWVDLKSPIQPGRVPQHQIDGKRIRFEQADGTWGAWIDLSVIQQSGNQIGSGSLRIHRYFDDINKFPTVGNPQVLYVVTTTTPYALYVWNNGAYNQISGPASANPASLISDDADNALIVGSDLKLYVTPPKVMIDDDQILTGDETGTVQITLTPETVVDPENPEQTQTNYTIKGDVKVVEIISEDDGNLLVIGEDLKLYSDSASKVVVSVKNTTAQSIAKGTVLMATGTVGASGIITTGPMDGTNPDNYKYLIGVAANDIPADGDGFAIDIGKVRGFDTTAWAEGDVLWVSTTTPGALTNVEPETGLKMPVAFVVTANANNGEIMVRVTPIDENNIGTKIEFYDSFTLFPEVGKERIIYVERIFDINADSTQASADGSGLSAFFGSNYLAYVWDNGAYHSLVGDMPTAQATDEFEVATDGQTEFTLTSRPFGTVSAFLTGIRLRKTAITVTGNTVTYVPSQNGNNPLKAGQIITFDYLA